MSEAEMLKCATARLDSIRLPTLEALDLELNNLYSILDRNGVELGEIYRIAIGINEIAAIVAMPLVGVAAFSLCNLLEGETGAVGNLCEAIELHISSIKIMREALLSERLKKLLIDDLHRLVAKMKI